MRENRIGSQNLLRLPETSRPVIEKQEAVGCPAIVYYRYYKISLTVAVEVGNGCASQDFTGGKTRRRCETAGAVIQDHPYTPGVKVVFADRHYIQFAITVEITGSHIGNKSSVARQSQRIDWRSEPAIARAGKE